MTTLNVKFGTLLRGAMKPVSVQDIAGSRTASETIVPCGARAVAAKARHLFRSAVTSALTASLLLLAPATSIQQVQAGPSVGYDEVPLVVRNDFGGLLRDRLRQIAKLRQESRPIEIRGGVCYSTCTMLMGLPNACVSPNTMFGFHGPSSYGRSLDQATFDRASAVIASYYPAPLQEWYMSDARFTIKGVRRVRGDNIIEMGIASC